MDFLWAAAWWCCLGTARPFHWARARHGGLRAAFAMRGRSRTRRAWRPRANYCSSLPPVRFLFNLLITTNFSIDSGALDGESRLGITH